MKTTYNTSIKYSFYIDNVVSSGGSVWSSVAIVRKITSAPRTASAPPSGAAAVQIKDGGSGEDSLRWPGAGVGIVTDS